MLLDLRKLSVPALSAAVLFTLVHGCGDDGGTAGGGGSPDTTTTSGAGPTTSGSASSGNSSSGNATATATATVTTNASSSTDAGASTTTATTAASSTSSGMCMPIGPETCGDPTDEDCDGTECAIWGHLYDGTATPLGGEIAVTPNGHIYMIGEIGQPGSMIDFNGTIVTATQAAREFLVKISPQGDTVWTTLLPAGSGAQAPLYFLVGATDDNVVIEAAFNHSIDFGGGVLQPDGWYDRAFVGYDGDGNFQWATSMATPEDGLLVTTTGISPLNEVVVVGHAADGTTYDGTMITSGNVGVDDRNWFGLALDAATGTLLWHDDSWQVGSENNDVYQALAFGPTGDIYIAGTVSSNLVFAGHTLPFVNDWGSGYVAHLDPDGMWVDGAMFGDNVSPETMTIGPNGEIVLGAWIEFFTFFGAATPAWPNRWALFALDDMWEPAWVHFMSEVPSLATAPNGDIGFVLGDNNDIAVDAPGTFPAIGTIDIVTGRIGLDGTIKWYRQFGAPNALVDDLSAPTTFGIQPDGKSIIAFRTSGAPIDFGSGPLGAGGTDLAIVQLAP